MKRSISKAALLKENDCWPVPCGHSKKYSRHIKSFFFVTAVYFFSCVGLISQNTVSGSVKDTSGEPLAGANVFIKGFYDGDGTGADGTFSFETAQSGSVVLMVSFLGYKAQEIKVDLTGIPVEVNFILQPSVGQLGDVIITAGMFEAGDDKKSITLNPLDIVTTPSAEGDIYGALMALPGTSVVGEDGRLFVRGGDGYESKTFIDGLLCKKPYSSSLPDLPSRGRFSPFLFSGTTFSTGGYSAEYGQALSSALILTTNSFPDQTQTELSLLTVGQGITQTFRDEKRAFSAGINYFNMAPYYRVVPQEHGFNTPPREISLQVSARQRLKNDGMLKVFSTFSRSQFGLDYPNTINPGSLARLFIDNRNSYTNINLAGGISHGWFVKGGLAVAFDDNRLDLQYFKVNETNQNFHFKTTAKKQVRSNLKVITGIEETFKQDYAETESGFKHISQFHDFGTAVFAESEWLPFDRLAARIGFRGEYSSLLEQIKPALRFSAAWKLNAYSQLSFAYGHFYQTPEEDLLRFTHNLDFERADHSILNWQWERDDRVVRIETYYKKYHDLVTFNSQEFWDPNTYKNSGSGFSKGLDVFYRDQRTIRSLDFWISYSLLDSKRLYRDYPQLATPTFAPKHSLSWVGKYWFSFITTQVGLSATVTSGRPYHNPNKPGFMTGITPHYSNVSINCSHLRDILGKPAIIYASVSNLLGRSNIFGYRYASEPDNNNVYPGYPVIPESKRFYLIGVFLTL